MNENGTGTRKKVHLKYTEIFSNHYKFRGSADDNKKKCHDGNYGHGVSLDNTWRTTRWEHTVFAFIFALIEVNDLLANSFFSKPDFTFMHFRKRLAYALIFNDVDET